MATIIIGNGQYRDPTQAPNYVAPEAPKAEAAKEAKPADAPKAEAAKEAKPADAPKAEAKK